jgi:hypothetical protein
MREVTLFERLRWECVRHPEDVKYDKDDPQYSVYFENYTDDAHYDSMRELVEDQGCNWYWYCDYYCLDSNDEHWGRPL